MVSELQRREASLKGLPLYAVGASSGGAFALTITAYLSFSGQLWWWHNHTCHVFSDRLQVPTLHLVCTADKHTLQLCSRILVFALGDCSCLTTATTKGFCQGRSSVSFNAL